MINQRRIVFFSCLLFFFTVPHTLEDFATGMPTKAGIPAPALALVISIFFSVQALGLYWLGQKRLRGVIVHLFVGLFWPVASGVAQLPTIISGAPYRSGFLSILYVFGMIIIGLLLFVMSIGSLRMNARMSK
jgi:hypothetical protein